MIPIFIVLRATVLSRAFIQIQPERIVLGGDGRGGENEGCEGENDGQDFHGVAPSGGIDDGGECSTEKPLPAVVKLEVTVLEVTVTVRKMLVKVIKMPTLGADVRRDCSMETATDSNLDQHTAPWGYLLGKGNFGCLHQGHHVLLFHSYVADSHKTKEIHRFRKFGSQIFARCEYFYR